MYKVTREFIKRRQPFTEFEVEVVHVKQIGGGALNKCFQNATDDLLRQDGNLPVSGWIVFRMDRNTESTAIVQHWWNADANGRFFDTTPDITSDVEYVIDVEICKYGQDHYERLANLIAVSLEYKNGVFYRVNDKLRRIPCTSFKTASFFEFNYF